jgi:AAA15 family ATPase/GTPase
VIKKIQINKYRKLSNISFDFNKHINIISGANGTCKSSILHIISNSFQAVKQNSTKLNSSIALKDIYAINDSVNTKIESLTRGDEEYNDPAPGVSGTLYTVTEVDNKVRPFRRKNDRSNNKNRFRMILNYKRGNAESLTSLPIVYLGLKRLFPFGEFGDDDQIKNIYGGVSAGLLEDAGALFKRFTGLEISDFSPKSVGAIKKRSEFKSTIGGIDSNTISSGEDNLFIILCALISLKRYYENITTNQEIESILLIDELDATLHPAYQIKLLDLFIEFSQNYKIQIFFTTHSITLLREALEKKTFCNVQYLIDNINNVNIMQEPDIYKIEQSLRNKTRKDIYTPSLIPVFSEDDEARLFIEKLFDFIAGKDVGFNRVRGLFHLVDAKIGCANLKTIFKDDKILKPTLRSICILDGDQQGNENMINNHIMSLPGNNNPEEMVLSYVETKFNDNQATFWNEPYFINEGWSKRWYEENVRTRIEEVKQNLSDCQEKGESVHGLKRYEYKKILNDTNIRPFLIATIQYWINDVDNLEEVKSFTKNLFTLFRKVCAYHNINSNDWENLSIDFGGEYA